MKLARKLTLLFGGSDPLKYRKQIIATAPIGYWPLDETSGTAAVCYGSIGTAGNGAYTDATLANAAAPEGGGKMCPLLNGTSALVNLYSVALKNAFNGALGTMLVWSKVASADVWADAAYRYLMTLGADNDNRVSIYKHSIANQFSYTYRAAGTAETVNDNTHAVATWVMHAITWSAAADEVKCYWNGTQVSTTQATLGTWAGVLANTYCYLGAATTPTYFWSGNIAHAAVYNKVLTVSEILALCQP